MKDKRLEYTVMDDAVPKRGGKDADQKGQAADPPENTGSGRSYGSPDPDEEAPQSESESTEGSA